MSVEDAVISKVRAYGKASSKTIWWLQAPIPSRLVRCLINHTRCPLGHCFSRSTLWSYLATCNYCSALRTSVAEQLTPSVYVYPRGGSTLYNGEIQGVSTSDARRARSRASSV